MKFPLLQSSELAIKVVFDPALAASAPHLLPKDFFVDPAEWDVSTWREKLMDFDQRVGDPSAIDRSRALVELVKHLVGLPAEQRENCLTHLLDTLELSERVNLEQILRIAHQIKQLPSDKQVALLDRLKRVAIPTITERRLGKEAFEAITKALGLDQPGPWSAEIEQAREYLEEFRSRRSAAPKSSRTPKKRVLLVDASTSTDPTPAPAPAPASTSTSTSAHISSKRPRLEIYTRKVASADESTAPPTVENYKSREDEIDAINSAISAAINADWNRDFDQYCTGRGTREERSEMLDWLLTRLNLLPPHKQPSCAECLFGIMDVGRPVDFRHAYLLWMQLASIRQLHPDAQIATDFGRRASQWAREAKWTPAEIRSADPMFKS